MIINRIIEFIDYKKLAVSKFERTINAGEGTIRTAFKNQKEINSKWLVKIHEFYSEINPIWLLTGKGNMILDDRNEISSKEINIEELAKKVESLSNEFHQYKEGINEIIKEKLNQAIKEKKI